VGVSIHAPTRGATWGDGQHHAPQIGFNPRPHAGGDKGATKNKEEMKMFQSTPPRGGRHRSNSTSPIRSNGFNPRPHAGGDKASASVGLFTLTFQSTPPRGGRLSEISCGSKVTSFNPRPHAGGDIFARSIRQYGNMFQSTPPRGGRRLDPSSCAPRRSVSIHTPTRGATGRRWSFHRAPWRFNPHPHAGGDRKPHPFRRIRHKCFNPHPHAGGDTR